MKRTGLGARVAVACALILAAGVGCSDDDDAGDAPDPAQTGGGTVSTNVAATTNKDGSISLITNLVFNPNPVLTPVLKLPAPKLIAPANGAEWDIGPGASGATINFEWAAVSGADSYSLAVKSPGASDFKTTSVDAPPTFATYPRGTNFWKVAAVKNGAPQTWSEIRSFIFR
jgi:hypothetical protein